MESVKLSCGESIAEVSLFGGMTTAGFRINGKRVFPLYQNPWGNTPKLDRFTANLKGDFFCLPFGIPPTGQLPGAWDVGETERDKKIYPHGYSANGVYEVIEVSSNRVTISLHCADNFIDRVERTVTLEENRLFFADTVYAKREFSAPVGIHPIFNLPEKNRSATLKIPSSEGFFTYPVPVDESSVFQNAAATGDPAQIPLKNGSTADMTALPLETDTEELLLAAGVREGKCSLVFQKEGYSVTLAWDKTLFPHCLFWLSNRGRAFSPWNGKNLCLGIEPVASAFDLGEAISNAENPLSEKGFQTSVRFTPDSPVRFEHRIIVSGL